MGKSIICIYSQTHRRTIQADITLSIIFRSRNSSHCLFRSMMYN